MSTINAPATPPVVLDPPAPAVPVLDGDTVSVPAAEVLANAGNVIVTLPQSALKQIKDKAAAKGQQRANAELEAQAKAAGFASFADALGALAAVKAGASTPAPAQPPVVPAQVAAAESQPAPGTAPPKALSAAEVTALAAQAAAQAVAAYKAEQDTLHAAQTAQTQTADALRAAGFGDVAYAQHLLDRAVAAVPAGEQFDASAWATATKKAQPYLFVDFKPAAANSGISPAAVGGAGAPPSSSQVAAGAAGAAKVDANTLSRDEINAKLRQMGLNPTSRSFL